MKSILILTIALTMTACASKQVKPVNTATQPKEKVTQICFEVPNNYAPYGDVRCPKEDNSNE